ncbi:MAG: hypothetical protein ACK5RL_20615 [Acidimicrobiales bacterium]
MNDTYGRARPDAVTGPAGDAVLEAIGGLADRELAFVAEEIRLEQRRRAVAAGDLDGLIAEGFDHGFGRDGLAVKPWIEVSVLICPGGLVARSRTNHRCRFVSLDEVWVWDSSDLIREDKRANPGDHDGFRAVALVPVVTGMAVDVVTGRARRGQHQLDRVESYTVGTDGLVEVATRSVTRPGRH